MRIGWRWGHRQPRISRVREPLERHELLRHDRLTHDHVERAVEQVAIAQPQEEAGPLEPLTINRGGYSHTSHAIDYGT